MKISNETLNILKNFSSINNSILIRPKEGDVGKISTVSTQKTIMAKAIIKEEFKKECAIYELSRFLGTVSLFDDPEFEFEDNHVLISSGQQATIYRYADPQSIVAAPEKDVTIVDPDVEFYLNVDDLSSLVKGCSVLGLPEVAIVGDQEHISLQAMDSKNPNSDNHKVVVGKTDKEFNMILKPENLKLVNSNYNVRVSAKGIVEFSNSYVSYWIATEASSTFKTKEK